MIKLLYLNHDIGYPSPALAKVSDGAVYGRRVGCWPTGAARKVLERRAQSVLRDRGYATVLERIVYVFSMLFAHRMNVGTVWILDNLLPPRVAD